MRVLALDPGEATGWAWGTVTDGELEVGGWGFDPWKTVAMHLATKQVLGNAREYDVLVYEAWRLRATAAKQLIGSDMQSSQMVGCIKLCGWLSGARIVSQEPAIKPVADKMMGGPETYLPRSTVDHDRDALRHLHYFHLKEKHKHGRD
jgi:hypothetical protein